MTGMPPKSAEGKGERSCAWDMLIPQPKHPVWPGPAQDFQSQK